MPSRRASKNDLSMTKVIVEIFSVVLAVMLALGANEWRQKRADQRLARIAVQNIREEILQNRDQLIRIQENHRNFLARIDTLLLQVHGEDEIVLNRGLALGSLSSTAWNTATITQATIHMDFQMISQLSKIYELQETYSEMADDFMLKIIYSSEFYDETKARETLRSWSSFFNAILGIESALFEQYNTFLQEPIHRQDEPEE